MYVKIVNSGERRGSWYDNTDFIDSIFQVEQSVHWDDWYTLIADENNKEEQRMIRKSDCEILNLESKCNGNCSCDSERISEEFAMELLKYTHHDVCALDIETFNSWKENGFIKKSREDELREKLKELENVVSDDFKTALEISGKEIYYLRELIEILDKKIGG